MTPTQRAVMAHFRANGHAIVLPHESGVRCRLRKRRGDYAKPVRLATLRALERAGLIEIDPNCVTPSWYLYRLARGGAS